MDKQSYEPEEVLSYDRMKRAVMKRILNRAAQELEVGFTMDKDRLAEWTADEWAAAKQFVRFSSDSTGHLSEYARQQISKMVQDMIESDKAELESLGVQDTAL